MDDEWFRNTAAQNMAHATLIDLLLRFALRDLPPAQLEQMRTGLKVMNTAFLTGLTQGDEAASERVADLTVRTQQHIALLVDAAVDGVKQTKRG